MAQTYMRSQEPQTLEAFIRQTIPNIPITQEAIKLIEQQFEPYTLSKHEYLLKEGRISGYYFMQEGFLRAFIHDKDGAEVTTAFYGGPRVIFEPASFFQHQPSQENIQAITDCKGYLSSFEKLNILFHSSPEFREFARAIIVKEFVAHKKQSISLINKSAEERYRDLINNNEELFQHAQLKHIASFLGMTDTSLSRIRREYARK